MLLETTLTFVTDVAGNTLVISYRLRVLHRAAALEPKVTCPRSTDSSSASCVLFQSFSLCLVSRFRRCCCVERIL